MDWRRIHTRLLRIRVPCHEQNVGRGGVAARDPGASVCNRIPGERIYALASRGCNVFEFRRVWGVVAGSRAFVQRDSRERERTLWRSSRIRPGHGRGFVAGLSHASYKKTWGKTRVLSLYVARRLSATASSTARPCARDIFGRATGTHGAPGWVSSSCFRIRHRVRVQPHHVDSFERRALISPAGCDPLERVLGAAWRRWYRVFRYMRIFELRESLFEIRETVCRTYAGGPRDSPL